MWSRQLLIRNTLQETGSRLPDTNVDLASMMKSMNSQLNEPVTHNAYCYDVQQDKEMLADWNAQ